MLRFYKTKGQSVVEYAVLLIIIMGALLAMQNYFKRGLQGRMRSATDGIGEQYDPLFTTANVTQRITGDTVTSITVQSVGSGYETLRSDNSQITERKTGFSRVDAQ